MIRAIIEAPNGTLIRADHIVSVSALFESIELGTDAFAVYTIGDTENPFVFAAPLIGEGSRAERNRKAETAKLREQFIRLWENAVSVSGFGGN